MFPYGSSLEPIERMNCTLHPFFLEKGACLRLDRAFTGTVRPVGFLGCLRVGRVSLPGPK